MATAELIRNDNQFKISDFISKNDVLAEEIQIYKKQNEEFIKQLKELKEQKEQLEELNKLYYTENKRLRWLNALNIDKSTRINTPPIQ